MQWLSIKTPLTTTDIQAIEEALNIHLPADYKETIGPINGGALRKAYVHIPETGDLPYSRNIPLDKSSKANALELAKIINTSHIRYFPFASVGNGDLFCFDLFDDNCIVVYLHESQRFISICGSFTKLLSLINFSN